MSLKILSLDINLEDLKQEILRNNFEILPLDFEHNLGLFPPPLPTKMNLRSLII